MKYSSFVFCFCVSFPNLAPTRHSVMDLKGISLATSRLEIILTGRLFTVKS